MFIGNTINLNQKQYLYLKKIKAKKHVRFMDITNLNTYYKNL